MALTVANNVSSLTAQHNLARSSSSLSKSLERLSSGLKVNRGADGPAALVISEKQRAQIAGLHSAIENSEKASLRRSDGRRGPERDQRAVGQSTKSGA